MISGHLQPILWAQWKSLLHFRPREGWGGLALAAIAALGWYGLWSGLAVAAGVFASSPAHRALLGPALPAGLLLVFAYWQLAPVLTASLGASLDLKKLMVYPIPRQELFRIEVFLRLTTSPEMLLVTMGMAAGLLLNPAIPKWAPLPALGAFVLFNLFVSAGVRQLLERLLARKRVQEVVVLSLVLLAGLPQLLLMTGVPPPLGRLFSGAPWAFWPWAAAGRAALGDPRPAVWACLPVFVLAAYQFGRWQFARSLRFDAAGVRSAQFRPPQRGSLLDRLWRWPEALFADPLAVVVEKELRTLTRTPRFRVVFLLGFTFGLVVWLPLAFGKFHVGGQAFRENYLTFVSAYALLLLGDVTFWNSLGFDRSAAQWYYLAPMPFTKVLIGKNIAAAFFVAAEVTAVTLACLLLRMPLQAGRVIEAYAVTLALSIYLLATGNLSSVYYPIGVSAEQSWKTTSPARFRALLFLVYPLASAPVLLAFAARYAFESEVALYLVLAVAVAVGMIYYWVALDSAREAAEARREKILAALGESAGPVSLG